MSSDVETSPPSTPPTTRGRSAGPPRPALPADPAATDPAVEFADVSCGYGGPPVLERITMGVRRGAFAAIVGPSGAGKTTLLRAMLGLVPRTSGTLRVNGVDVRPGVAPPGVGYVPQVDTIDWGFPVTVENVVLMGLSTGLGRLPWPSRDERARLAAVLDDLGMAGLSKRRIRDLSGGQQHRVFLARALIGEPTLLVLDEPTASVDIKTRDDILRHLAHLNERGTTIVVTTHELNALAAHLPEVVCVNRAIVAAGPPRVVFTDAILSRTFNAEMRVVEDAATGNLLVAEAGSHGPFGKRSAHPGPAQESNGRRGGGCPPWPPTPADPHGRRGGGCTPWPPSPPT